MALYHSGKCKSSAESACNDGVDWDAVDAALEQVSLQTATKRPVGFTVQEYAKKKKLASRTARDHLMTMYRAGLVERTIWKQDSHLVYIYRLVRS